jgi:hypothetical protein
MRIATLIVGLVLTIGLFVQSLLVSAGSSITSDKSTEGAAGWGLIASLGFLIASALVIAKPRFSLWTFVVCSAICFIAGASTAFRDLIFWGFVAAVLAFMSWRGSIEKRRRDAKEAERDAAVAALLQRQSETQAVQ